MIIGHNQPKHLLIFLCDQLQRQVLGCYGGRVPTPNWDALAARGATFDHAYCASPLCVPARASLMTGVWPHSHGARAFGEGYETLNPGVEILPDRLQAEGYRVAYEGIWHIMGEDRSGVYTHYNSRAFPYQEHIEMLVAQGGQKGEQLRHVRTRTDDGSEVEWTFSVPVPATWARPAEEHPDMVSARRIADFMRTAPGDQPLALWCSLGGPHPPLIVPEAYMKLFSPEAVEPPASFGEDMTALPQAVAEAPGRQAVRDWTWEQWARATAAYWGYIAFLDACFGVVLEALRESELEDETLVIAHTDHGEMLGAHNLYQKGVLYDESIRLPLVVAGPGVAAGRRSQLVSQVDIVPTVLDMLDLPPVAQVQGESLCPILEDPSERGRDHIFSEFNGDISGGVHIRGVVTHRHKYVYHHDDRDQLFDREADPNELHNLVKDASTALIRDDLRNQLLAWMTATGDFLSPHWDD